nr:venom protein U-MPTX.16-Mc14 [Megalopyge crispata]
MKLHEFSFMIVLIFYTLHRADGECGPIESGLTTAKTGQKALDKCIEYQEKYIYPCENGKRANHCKHSPIASRILGGTDTSRGEFPHMALLGYGHDAKTAYYQCGGSIISEKFVLTAGHCIYEPSHGQVEWVKIGIQSRSEPVDESKLYKIANIHSHPEFHTVNLRNDIALLEMDREMHLGEFAVPICLPVTSDDYNEAMSTGWGFEGEDGDLTENLKKVTLPKYSKERCHVVFPDDDRLNRTYNEKIHLCYSDKTGQKDSCQGDSGGPLQVENHQVSCMYTIIGITSYGVVCGFPDTPALYTRVSNYVSWIESIVWK